MPRPNKLVVHDPVPAPAAPTPPLRVIPDNALHVLSEWGAILGLRPHTLKREARLKRLRAQRRAGRLWATGKWIKEWIVTGEVKPRQSSTEADGER
jgi:hypothetical protein